MEELENISELLDTMKLRYEELNRQNELQKKEIAIYESVLNGDRVKKLALSTNEAALLLGFTPRKVSDLCKNKYLIAFKDDRKQVHWNISPVALVNYKKESWKKKTITSV